MAFSCQYLINLLRCLPRLLFYFCMWGWGQMSTWLVFSCLWSSVSLQKRSLTDTGLSQVPRALTGRPWKWRTALARRSVSLPAPWHIQTDRSLRANDSSLLEEMIEAHHRDLYQSRYVCVCVCVHAQKPRWKVKTWGMRTASVFFLWKWEKESLTSYRHLNSKTSFLFLAIWVPGNLNLMNWKHVSIFA